MTRAVALAVGVACLASSGARPEAPEVRGRVLWTYETGG